jgi:hypothetical protein
MEFLNLFSTFDKESDRRKPKTRGKSSVLKGLPYVLRFLHNVYITS